MCRFESVSAIPPIANDAKPKSGPRSELPVNGSEPGEFAAIVAGDADVGGPETVVLDP